MKTYVKYNGWYQAILVATILALLIGCAQDELDPLRRLNLFGDLDVASVEVNFCTMDADQIESDLKFIFVIDKSGSNGGTISEPGTDPNGYRRYTPLLNFLDATEDSDTVFYSAVNFSTNASTVFGFSNDRSAFRDFVQDEQDPTQSLPPQPVDGGWTNYLSALTRVRNLINADIEAAKDEVEVRTSHYVVFFVSDGLPFEAQDDLQDSQDILDSIEALKSVEINENAYVGSIQVHTGYYTNDVDLDARTLMQDMSEKGDGNYFEFAAGQLIDFSQFAIPERSAKHFLSDIFVTNTNQVWEEGYLSLDSDGDGVSDITEVAKNSDPYNRDSDFNGVSDGVEYRMTGRVCRDALCSPAGAEPYTVCNRFLSDDPNEVFTDQDKDGLNDCEEQGIMGSERGDFDTNQDWIPDPLAFRFEQGLLEGTRDAGLDADWDGLSNYAEIKLNTPKNIDNSTIVGLKPYEYRIETISQDANQDCYRVTVDQIVIIGAINRIGVYLLENTSIVDDERFMRYSEQDVSAGEKKYFYNEDF